MIKKLNIALVVIFALMIAFKMVLILKESAGDVNETPAVAIEDPRSKLTPHVYYDDWPPFACKNHLSNHNGFLLDIVRSIFPKAEFYEHTEGAAISNDLWKIERAAADPLAVIVTMGEFAQGFETCIRAPTPIAWYQLRLITLRSNPWRYTGPESLKSLKIVADRYSLDNELALELQRQGNLKVLPQEGLVSSEILRSGKADAIIECCSSGWSAIAEESSQLMLASCRHSEPIGQTYLYFRTVTNDLAVSQALIRDYEAGLERIKKSGEYRRICEYYGFKD